MNFNKLSNNPNVFKYCGYKEFVGFTEVYVIVKTNHSKGNVCFTVRCDNDFLKDNETTFDVVIDCLNWQINNLADTINFGDISIIDN